MNDFAASHLMTMRKKIMVDFVTDFSITKALLWLKGVYFSGLAMAVPDSATMFNYDNEVMRR